jgi:hypothetical protein
MTDILTLCLASEAGDVKTFLEGRGQTWVATYPLAGDVVSVSTYDPPNVTLMGAMNKAGAKALVHTRI